jgi:hypothetical protein
MSSLEERFRSFWVFFLLVLWPKNHLIYLIFNKCFTNIMPQINNFTGISFWLENRDGILLIEEIFTMKIGIFGKTH